MVHSIAVWVARLTLLVVTVVLIITSLSQYWSPMPELSDIRLILYKNVDKLGHFLSMSVVTIVGLFAFPNIRAHWLFCSWLLMAAVIEFAQLFADRSADYFDFASGACGTVTVAAVFYCAKFRAEFANNDK